jgi:uncharacterized membrane protein
MKVRLQSPAGWACRRPGRAGQVMVEYVVVTGLLLGVLVMLAVFLYAFKEYGDRILDLIAYEYP